MITLIESILKSTGSGIAKYKLDYQFGGKRHFAFYDDGWEENNIKKQMLIEKGVDAIKVFNQFWDMSAVPGSRLYKVMEIFKKDKKIDMTLYDYTYIWRDEDVEKIKEQMAQIGWKVSRPTRKEVNQFQEINGPNLEAYLKLEKDNFMGMMMFPTKLRNGQIYQEIDYIEQKPALKKKWWDKSSHTPKTDYYRTKIYFL